MLTRVRRTGRLYGRPCVGIPPIALGILLVLAAHPLGAQQVRGTVLDAATERPLSDASVAILAADGSELVRVVTDSVGRFASVLPDAGRFSLRVERLGYRTLATESFQIADGEILELKVRTGVDAVPLAPVEVAARRRAAVSHADFDRRLKEGTRTGFGKFLTREDIENTAMVRTSSLLMMVPSIRLVHARDGSVYLGVADRGMLNCRPAVFMNGMEVSQAHGLDALASLDELGGIEVYRWRSEIPAELAFPGVCSAVAFWTRTDGSDRAWSWRRLAVGGGLAAAVAIFGFFR